LTLGLLPVFFLRRYVLLEVISHAVVIHFSHLLRICRIPVALVRQSIPSCCLISTLEMGIELNLNRKWTHPTWSDDQTELNRTCQTIRNEPVFVARVQFPW